MSAPLPPMRLPICLACQKPVRLVATERDILTDSFRVAVKCHGEVEISTVSVEAIEAAATAMDVPLPPFAFSPPDVEHGLAAGW